MDIPLVSYTNTGIVNSLGKEYKIETNFLFESDIYNYFTDHTVSMASTKMDERSFYIYFSSMMFSTDQMEKHIESCIKKYLQDHFFMNDPISGTMSIRKEDKNRTVLPYPYPQKEISKNTIDNLQKKLNAAVEVEDYLKAAELRDMINTLKLGKETSK